MRARRRWGIAAAIVCAAGCQAGTDPRDADGDGRPAGVDCDDSEAGVYPGAEELPDGRDNDCDQVVDEGTSARDDDGDGLSEDEGDCDDGDPSVHPGAAEGCDGGDSDCDGWPGPEEVDADADGATPCDGDCDDADPTAFPGAACLRLLGDAGAVLTGSLGSDHAGSALAAAGDLDGDGRADLFVGSPWYGAHADRAGMATAVTGLLVRMQPAMSLDATAAPVFGTAERAEVGAAVAALSDLDGDGAAEVAVGAPGEGAVRLYAGAQVVGPESTTPSDALLTLLGPVAGDQAGAALAAVDDLDGDGLRELAVGAPTAPSPEGGVGGAVYVVLSTAFAAAWGDAPLEGIAAAWAEGGRGEALGTALAADGDLDGDGRADLLVGAPGAGVGGAVRAWSGAAVVAGGALSRDDVLAEARAASPGDELGVALAYGEAADGGVGVWAGAPGARAGSRSGARTGVALFFDARDLVGPGSAGGPRPRAAIAGTASGQELGASLARVGDLDGDGVDEWLFGAPGASLVASRGGGAWLFRGADLARGGERPLSAAWYAFVGGEPGDAGASVGGPGDVDGDGLPDLAIGAPATTSGGAVYLWFAAALAQ